ncbi:MAG: polynucleotide adenylyltransferase PcnB [Planctomycetes bacterium]|nr:polynucleotide adenylyltransferase PcnB [Planctomycetota bacterium]MCB9903973.1 polynucleotide adenylyltransferase PcnB [Planctomycetota bacterium]
MMHAPELLDSVRDEDALRVTSRLARSGYQAFLVGGCVRDLYVGRKPKDFDVATNAHPRQVRRLFPRNSHIIGRRFRLVHVRYGRDSIVETATFRAEPNPNGDDDDLLITEDNEYGTAATDAQRRDFTVNGLFLDPASGEIHDYVGGLDDLETGTLRTIGDPFTRLAEDPVRILRAVKFATRLGFQIEDMTWEAMCGLTPELSRAAPPRVFEEILRLLRSGTALGAFRKMRSCGALDVILPDVEEHLAEIGESDAGEFWRLLEALDSEVHRGYQPSTAVCVALLHYDRIVRQADPETRTLPGKAKDLNHVAGDLIAPLAELARLSRKDSGRARRIIVQQRTFVRPASKNFRPRLFCLSEDFDDALELFRLRASARGQGWDIYEGWVERKKQAESLSDDELDAERKKGRRRSRPRRRRRSGGSGGSGGAKQG